ncbi:MAG: DUF748 domain-containing protein [Gammaproteobacteria bacterium]|nr:DUF748 domain-containing protein [Gammaproteobacteria bacterium]
MRRFFIPLLLLILALILCIPWVLKQGVLTNLRAQGYDASLESVGNTPGHLQLRNLRVSRGGEPITHIQNLDIRYQLGGLLIGRLAAHELIIDGSLLTLNEDAQGNWSVLGIPSFNSVTDSAQETRSDLPQAGIERIDIRDSRLRLKRPNSVDEIDLKQIYLGRIATWEPDQSTPYNLDVHGAFGHIAVTGHATPLSTDRATEGRVQLQDLNLTKLARLVMEELPAPLVELQGLVNGTSDYQAHLSGGQWHTKAQIQATLAELKLATTDARTASIQALNLNTQINADPERVTIEGDAHLKQVRFAQPDLVASLTAGSWRGRLNLPAGALDSSGKVDLHDLQLSIGDKQQIQFGGLQWQGALARGGNGQLSGDGELLVDSTQITQPELNLDLAALAWHGQFKGNPAISVALDGELKADTLVAQQAGNAINGGQLSWHGQSEVAQLDAATPQITLNGNLELHNWQVADGEHLQAALTNLSGQQIDLKRVGDQFQVKAGELTLHELIARQAPQSLSITRLHLARPEFHLPMAVRGEHVEIDGLDAKVIRAKPVATAKSDAQAANSVASAPTADAPLIAIGGLSIANSQVSFTDQGVEPAFTALIKGLDIDIGAFDSALPDTPSDARLSAILGEVGQLELNGQIRPLQPTAFAELRGSLLGFDMPQLNPYLRANLGDEVESGQLDVNADIHIEQNQLDVLNRIEVRKLVLRKADKPGGDKEEGSGSLLNSAVSLLSDSNDTINLKLPITGAVDDPQFDLSDAINKALSKSIATGVLLYFQPLGALVAIGKLATSEFSVLEFNPVGFEAGSASLDATATAYLADLSKRLADRPNILIKICAVATESDRAALQPPPPSPKPDSKDSKTDAAAPPRIDNVTLLKLAKQRANAVTEHLNKALGIDGKRLIGCAASISKQPKVKPEVRLGQ